MSGIFRLHVGDTTVVLPASLQYIDETGVVVFRDLTGLTVKFKLRNLATNRIIVAETETGVTVVTAASGSVNYDFSASGVNAPGIYKGWFVVYDGVEASHYPPDTSGLLVYIDSDTRTAEEAYQLAIDLKPVSSFPEELTIGDTYDIDTGRIRIEITDDNGDPLSALGDLQFDEADVSFVCFRPNDATLIEGTCTFENDGDTYVLLTLTASATATAKAEYTYEGRLQFLWSNSSGSDDDVRKTFKTNPFKFVANPL